MVNGPSCSPLRSFLSIASGYSWEEKLPSPPSEGEVRSPSPNCASSATVKCCQMGDFSVQISNALIDRLLDNGERLKRKTKKIKPRVPKEVPTGETKPAHPKPSDDSGANKGPPSIGWSLTHPLYVPVSSPLSSVNAELDAIRSVLTESEKVVERLRTQEESMTNEVTQRAKELHEKEFKLPHQKPMPCLAENNACMECYKEHMKDPLKCAHLVKIFANCARRARQQMSSLDK